jgi:hypothetical protein
VNFKPDGSDMGQFPPIQVRLDEMRYRTLAKMQLIWNDRCQHLRRTWRRPGEARWSEIRLKSRATERRMIGHDLGTLS